MSLSAHKVNYSFCSANSATNPTNVQIETTSQPKDNVHCLYCPAETPRKYLVNPAEIQTEQPYNPFKDLTLEKVKDMKNLELKSTLSKIIAFDCGKKFDIPLSSWFVYLVEFFDCHYSYLGMISSSQRNIAIEIISKYLPENKETSFFGVDSHPSTIRELNKSKVKKLLANKWIEECDFLTRSEIQQIKQGATSMIGGKKLRYNYIIDIYFDNAQKRKWFDSWIKDIEQNLNNQQMKELNDLLIDIKYTDWSTAERSARLAKLIKPLGYNIKPVSKTYNINELPDLRLIKENIIDSVTTRLNT